MRVLVSEKLSEHKYKTPEGYLICTDAILARTGKQSYTKDELFQDGDNTEVDVDRPYDEVMNAKTIASLENKPITFDHPDEDVNVGNYKDYAVGYVRDAHQGKTDKGEDVILGNLVITDQDAINAIEQGDHTDLSCGYDCDIRDDGNGNYSQTNIRINHLALCEQGRAGIARIVDSKVKDEMNYSKEMKAVRNALRHIVVDNKSEMKQLIQDLIDNKPMNYSLEVRRLKRAIDELIKWSDNRQEGIDTIWAIAKENRIVDSKMEDDETIDYKGIKIGVLHTSIGTLYEVRYNKNKADWPEYKKLENAKKYIDIFLTKGEQAANASWKIDDTIVDSKVKDASKIVYYDPETGAKVLYDYELGYCVKWHNKYSMSSTYDRNRAIKWAKDENWIANETWLSKDEQMFDSIVDSKVKDDNLLGKRVRIRKRYSNLDGTIGKIHSYEGTNYDDKVEVERNGHFYTVNYEDIEFLDSKVEDVNYSEKEIKEAAMKLLKQKPFLIYEEALQKVKENIKNGNYLLDNKIEDAEYVYKLTKKKNDYDEYVIQAYKNGKKNEDATYYTDDWDDAINTLKSIAKQEKLAFRQQGSVFIADNKVKAFNDSKEMTMSDAIKMLNIVDAYKKVRDAEWKKDNAVYYKFESGYWHVFSIYNRNKLSPENVTKLARQYNVSIASYENESLRKDYDTDVWYYESYVVKGKDKQNVIKFCEKLNPRVAPLKFEDSIKDASTDKWVIKNTGLAYEVWNQGKIVKKFPTKKLAIEWIHSRFPTDEITEDSKKVALDNVYKKVKDADVNFLIKGKKVKTNVYNRNKLDFGNIWNLGRKYNIKVEQMFRGDNSDFWFMTDITNKDNLFKMMREVNPALSSFNLNDIFEKALKK